MWAKLVGDDQYIKVICRYNLSKINLINELIRSTYIDMMEHMAIDLSVRQLLTVAVVITACQPVHLSTTNGDDLPCGFPVSHLQTVGGDRIGNILRRLYGIQETLNTTMQVLNTMNARHSRSDQERSFTYSRNLDTSNLEYLMREHYTLLYKIQVHLKTLYTADSISGLSETELRSRIRDVERRIRSTRCTLSRSLGGAIEDTSDVTVSASFQSKLSGYTETVGTVYDTIEESQEILGNLLHIYRNML